MRTLRISLSRLPAAGVPAAPAPRVLAVCVVWAPIVVLVALATAGCAAIGRPQAALLQRIDGLLSDQCKADVLWDLRMLLKVGLEDDEVAAALAQKAYDSMAADVPGQPRAGSPLAADLRIKSSRAAVASSSGNQYVLLARRNPPDGACELRMTRNGAVVDFAVPVHHCRCEDAQE